MKKSLLAIVLLAGGITLVTAQKKETHQLKNAEKVENSQNSNLTLQTAKAIEVETTEVQADDNKKANGTRLKKADSKKKEDETRMKKADALQSSKSKIGTQKANQDTVD